MAKDPAVLFYTSDFLTGTMTMTHEQVGKYIRLLCLQHQRGILSEKDMINICSSYDEDVFGKFTKTSDGYYNERMREEAEKRRAFVESRGRNRKKGIENHNNIGNNICSSYENHMENENEDVNESIIVNRKRAQKQKFVAPSKQDVIDFFKEKGYIGAERAFDYYDAAGWKDGHGKPVRNWKQKMISVWFKPENKAQEVTDRYANSRRTI